MTPTRLSLDFMVPGNTEAEVRRRALQQAMEFLEVDTEEELDKHVSTLDIEVEAEQVEDHFNTDGSRAYISYFTARVRIRSK